MKKKFLLDVCCAPCLCGVYPQIRKNFSVFMYFQGDNLDTSIEFEKRKEGFLKYCMIYGITDYIIKPYDHESWLNYVKGFENEPEKGKRCILCFKYRIQQLSGYPEFNKFDQYSTTLSVSPYKNFQLVRKSFMETGGIIPEFYDQPFNKGNWYKNSIKISKALGLYRQKYCGCEFSKLKTSKNNNS